MEPLSTLVFPLVAGGIYVVGVLTRHRQLLDQWKALVAQHELVPLETSSLWAPRLHVTARAGTVEVRFERLPKRGLWVQLTIPGHLAYSGLRLRREMFMPWAGREIEVGDGEFDKTFIVEGTPGMVMALLDSQTRRLLLQVNAGGELEVRGGVIRVKVTDRTLPNLLPLLLELGERFTQGGSIPRRLAANTRDDPEPRVRLNNLLLLAREHREEQVTADTLRAACKDKSPEIRLRAAIELGTDGRKTLLALAEDDSGNEHDGWSAQAVSALGRGLPWERAVDLLRRALRRERWQTAQACVAVLGQWRGAAIDELAKVLDHESNDLAVAAAQALGETGEAAAEPPLLRALWQGSVEMRIAAAGALGRVGSVAAVLPLQEAGEEDRDVRRAARQAIGEIQSRLQGATPGQLSLAQADAGQLSLAIDPAGQLSLPPEGRRPEAVP